MTAVKIAGVLIGAFLLLMWGFIQPAQRADPELVGIITLLGVAVAGGAAFMAIRGIVRNSRSTGGSTGLPSRRRGGGE